MKLTLATAELLTFGLALAGQRPAPIKVRQEAGYANNITQPQSILVPIDHFHNESRYEPHSDGMFNLTYYYDAQYYRKGGPVIVLQGGETSVEGRLPYLEHGIVSQLAEATGGVGVILEHRYYGTSFPTDNLTTENFRFLSTEQAMADQQYFGQNVVFPGLEDVNLTSPGTAYIAYGGSYAGAFVAFMRVQYPDDTWGAISSSGVTEAIWDFWEYYEAQRKYAPAECIYTHERLLNIMDNILMSGDNSAIQSLLSAFNSTSFSYLDDFANTMGSSLGYWQSLNWDPAVSDPTVFWYCGNITSQDMLFPNTSYLESSVPSLIEAGGWSNLTDELKTPMLNFIGWSVQQYVGGCDLTLDECYTSHNASAYADKSTDQYDTLSWPYQYCTEWGFLQPGSTVPEDEFALISRLVTLNYSSLICNYAFNISTGPPQYIDNVNKYGGFNISYPRLAIIGGEADPWRAASPLATLDVPTRLNTTSTISQPIVLIEGNAVHHWDENGIYPNQTTGELPPIYVKDAQAIEAQSVEAWMQEWYLMCQDNPGYCNNV